MPATSEASTLLARPEALSAIHAMLDRFWQAVEARRGGPVPDELMHGFATAVAEVAANIIRHAKVESFGFSLRLDAAGAAEARFDDTGIALEGDPTQSLDSDEFREGGRGLALAKRALDLFVYERLPNDTNRWLLIRRLPELT